MSERATEADGFRRVFLVRYAEVGLKGLNRPAFERALEERVRASLAGVAGARVRRRWGRIVVETPGEGAGQAEPPGRGSWSGEVLRRLCRVFGVASVSPALAVPARWEDIERAAAALVGEALAGRGGAAAGGRQRANAVGAAAGDGGFVTFKVAANRADKSFPLTSLEINRRLGPSLLQLHPSLRVDVRAPELTVAVDVREEAFLYTESAAGPGGLPVGVSGRGLLLLSGGIDSPVAGWRMMKRGMEVEAVHFHSPPFTGEQARDKVVDLCRVLAGWGGVGRVRLHLVRFTEAQTAIYERCPARLGVILMRRLMVRVAEAIARRRGALALVTGESLGQVASQTLESMAAINAVGTLPVLRPLVGMDKEEIVEQARAVGTYPVSVRPYEDCCTVFVARHPATRPRLADVEEAEGALPVDELAERSLAATEELEVPAGQVPS